MKKVSGIICVLSVLAMASSARAFNFSVHGKMTVRQDMGDADEFKKVIADPMATTSVIVGGDNEKNLDFQNIYTGAEQRSFDAGTGLDLWIDSKVNEKIDSRIGFSGAGKGQTDIVLGDTYISHKIDVVGDFRVSYNKPKFGIDPALFAEELGVGGTSPERFNTRHWQLLLNGKAEVVDYSFALIDGFGHDTTTSIRPRPSKDYCIDFSTEAGNGIRVGGSYYNDRIAEDAEGDVSKYAFYLIYTGHDFDFKSQYTAYIKKDKFKNFVIGSDPLGVSPISKDIYSYGYWINMNYRFYERVMGILHYSGWDKYKEISPQLEFNLAENSDFRIIYLKYIGPDGMRTFDSNILRTELEISF
ncbi:MAG: hypothetical protein PHX78_06990 [bacterium]|nr:hypothetical protein [bacterium]